MCSITGQYLADVLHARTRAIHQSIIDQANDDSNDDNNNNDQNTQNEVTQQSQPIATRTRSTTHID